MRTEEEIRHCIGKLRKMRILTRGEARTRLDGGIDVLEWVLMSDGEISRLQEESKALLRGVHMSKKKKDTIKKK